VSDLISIRVGPKGRVVIPIAIRELYDLEEGDELVVVPEADGIRLVDRTRLVASLRGSVRTTDGRSVVDELIAERRAAAAHEAMP
jgi:AbrB family looped-hinge helix DNA binding protein